MNRAPRLAPFAPFLAFALIGASVVGLALASRDTPHPGWVALGQLARPRSLATTVALPTGDVLVVGGLDDNDPTLVNTTSELIDPYFGTTKILPDTMLGRVNHTATLAGQKVVVAGGTERDGKQWTAVARVDVYDVAKQTWKWSAPLSTPRSDHGATALKDGRVLVAGGTDGPRQLESAEIYDPLTDKWTHATSLPEPRSQFTMAVLPDGKVLVAGGITRGLPTASTVIYDPAKESWENGPRMDSARVLHAAVTLAGGDILMIGGQREGGGSAERYDTRRGFFVPAGILVQPRMLGSAVRLPDKRVLVVGGLLIEPGREGFVPLGDAEVWDPSTNLWADVPDPFSARALGSLVLTRAGALWVGGAGPGEHSLSAIERFNWR